MTVSKSKREAIFIAWASHFCSPWKQWQKRSGYHVHTQKRSWSETSVFEWSTFGSVFEKLCFGAQAFWKAPDTCGYVLIWPFLCIRGRKAPFYPKLVNSIRSPKNFYLNTTWQTEREREREKKRDRETEREKREEKTRVRVHVAWGSRSLQVLGPVSIYAVGAKIFPRQHLQLSNGKNYGEETEHRRNGCAICRQRRPRKAKDRGSS